MGRRRLGDRRMDGRTVGWRRVSGIGWAQEKSMSGLQVLLTLYNISLVTSTCPYRDEFLVLSIKMCSLHVLHVLFCAVLLSVHEVRLKKHCTNPNYHVVQVTGRLFIHSFH